MLSDFMSLRAEPDAPVVVGPQQLNMLSPSGIVSNCRVSRSEVHFSTANISPHKY